MLFAPVDDVSEDSQLPPEYWKRLMTVKMAASLDEALKENGGKMLAQGDVQKWKQKHREGYWEAVAALMKEAFGPRSKRKDSGDGEEGTKFHQALGGVMEQRISDAKQKLILPMYSKELRQAVFSWFHLTAPAFYVVRALSHRHAFG